MEVTTRELGSRPKKIATQASAGQEITITYRGKPMAKIVPLQPPTSEGEVRSMFGMWQDTESGESVEKQVRKMREARQF